MELKNKTVIVTGAGGGIGAGIAVVLGRKGANVVVADQHIERAREVVEEIVSSGSRALPLEADVTRKAAIEEMVATTIKNFGGVDILVNNAGIQAPPALAKDISEEQWDRVLSVNLKGVFLCCQAVIPAMMAKGKGRIINIGSIAAIRMTFLGSIDYTVSKHGVAGLTQHLAWELADHHITVNAICPGLVFTPLVEGRMTPQLREIYTRRIPLGRFTNTQEIGEAVSFLASDHAEMITGQFLSVDGGLLTGFGEDLRAVVKQGMGETKAKAHG